MTALMPPGYTESYLIEIVHARPIHLADLLKLNVNEKTWEGYVQETFKQLNDKYGFEFEIPFQTKKAEDAPPKVQEVKDQVAEVHAATQFFERSSLA